MEDGIDLGSFSFSDFEKLLKPILKVHPHHSEEYRQVAKLGTQKVSYLRSKTIFVLVKECVEEFLKHEDEFLAGAYQGSLVESIPHADVIKKAKKFGAKQIYHHPRKQYGETAAFEIIEGLADEFAEDSCDDLVV
jgi:dGTP triphosphohydrolase